MSNAEEYLKKNVKGILEPLLKKILDERPSEPVTNKNINILLLNNIDFLYDKLSRRKIQYQNKDSISNARIN